MIHASSPTASTTAATSSAFSGACVVGRLAGGAVQHQAVVTGGDEVPRQLDGGAEVDLAVRREGRDHRGEHGPERAGGRGGARHGATVPPRLVSASQPVTGAAAWPGQDSGGVSRGASLAGDQPDDVGTGERRLPGDVPAREVALRQLGAPGLQGPRAVGGLVLGEQVRLALDRAGAVHLDVELDDVRTVLADGLDDADDAPCGSSGPRPLSPPAPAAGALS